MISLSLCKVGVCDDYCVTDETDGEPRAQTDHTLNKGNFSNEFMDGLMGTQDKWNAMGGVEGYVAMSRKQRAEEGYP